MIHIIVPSCVIYSVSFCLAYRSQGPDNAENFKKLKKQRIRNVIKTQAVQRLCYSLGAISRFRKVRRRLAKIKHRFLTSLQLKANSVCFDPPRSSSAWWPAQRQRQSVHRFVQDYYIAIHHLVHCSGTDQEPFVHPGDRSKIPVDLPPLKKKVIHEQKPCCVCQVILLAPWVKKKHRRKSSKEQCSRSPNKPVSSRFVSCFWKQFTTPGHVLNIETIFLAVRVSPPEAHGRFCNLVPVIQHSEKGNEDADECKQRREKRQKKNTGTPHKQKSKAVSVAIWFNATQWVKCHCQIRRHSPVTEHGRRS